RARVGHAMNHQWGRRSSASSSCSWRSFLSNATGGTLAPAELVEAPVVDAEVVGDLVHDRDGDLLDHLLLGGADRADVLAEDRDPVRGAAAEAVAVAPRRQRHALVEAEEPSGPGPVAHEHGDVV